MSTKFEELRSLYHAFLLLDRLSGCCFLMLDRSLFGDLPKLPRKFRKDAWEARKALSSLNDCNYHGFIDDQEKVISTAREFLYSLMCPKKTPRIHSLIRNAAFVVLKHYPLDGKHTDYSLFETHYKSALSRQQEQANGA